MTLADMIKADSLRILSTEDFAEPAVYFKRSGLSRPINANIERQQVSVMQEDKEVVIPIFEVTVHNNATTGISSLELNRGGDELMFPTVVGGPVVKHAIIRLTYHDAGVLVLECR